MATSAAHGVRWSSGVAAVLILVFFTAVAWFLGPDLLKPRADKAVAFALHIGGGLLVLATAPFQFIAPIRNRYRRFHRIAGYAFVAGSVAAIGGFFALLPVELDLFLISQLMAIILWACSVMAALVAIRRKHVLTHQHNMARAFVLAAYFVIVRVVEFWFGYKWDRLLGRRMPGS